MNLRQLTLALSIAAALPVMADTVKISGASTVFNVVVKSTQAQVEKASGHTLEITNSNTGKGLIDLVNGAANMAMVSEPMDIAVAAAAAGGKQIDPKTLQFFEIRKDEVVFVVHPSNPVAKLSWEQLRDIHTGKIKNWKDVGGKDLAIVVYAEGPAAGTRNLVKKIVCGREEFSKDAKPQTSIKRVAEQVAGDPAGVGGVGRSFAIEAKAKVLDTKKLERPLGFATLGAPKPAEKAVIDAFLKAK
jgi:phosphate transport system substrate-binding protein